MRTLLLLPQAGRTRTDAELTTQKKVVLVCLRADGSQGMLDIIRCIIFCFPVFYPEI